jgi:cell division protein FtsB
MKLLTGLLIAMLLLLHAELWFGKSGVPRVMSLQSALSAQVATNTTARERNAQLSAEVIDLQEGLEMVEEKARLELGMVKPDEWLIVVSRREAGDARRAAAASAARTR